MVPAATDQQIRLILLELDRKDAVIMSRLVPFYSIELMRYLLGLLIIDPDNIVLSRSRKSRTVGVVINGHDIVAFFKVMPDLLACLGRVLVEMTVGVGNQEDRRGTTIELIDRSPSESVDWALLASPSIDLCDFVVGAKVEDPNVTIGVSAGCHGILLVELGDHEFGLLGDDGFHEDFVLEGYFFDDSRWEGVYLWKTLVDLFCI